MSNTAKNFDILATSLS